MTKDTTNDLAQQAQEREQALIKRVSEAAAEWSVSMAAAFGELAVAIGQVADVLGEWSVYWQGAYLDAVEQYAIARGSYRFPLYRQLQRRGCPERVAQLIMWHAPDSWLPWLLYDEELDVPLAVLGR